MKRPRSTSPTILNTDILDHVSKYVRKKKPTLNIKDDQSLSFIIEKLASRQQSYETTRQQTKAKSIIKEPQTYFPSGDDFLNQMKDHSLYVSKTYELVEKQQERYHESLLISSAKKYGKAWSTQIVQKLNSSPPKPDKPAKAPRACSAVSRIRESFYDREIPQKLSKNNPTLQFLLRMSSSKRRPMVVLKQNIDEAVERLHRRQNKQEQPGIPNL